MIDTDVDSLKECFGVNICNTCGVWKVVINIQDCNDQPENQEPKTIRFVCIDCLSQANKELCHGR